MKKFKRRVAALESTRPSADQFTIICRMGSPGQLDAEVYGLRSVDGNFWARLPGETKQGLIDRASKIRRC